MENNGSEQFKLSDLDQQLLTFDGEVLAPNQNLTFRNLYTTMLGNSVANNGDEAIENFSLGMKISKAKSLDDLDIEERAQLLKVAKGFPGQNTMVKAQLILFIDGKLNIKPKIKQEAKLPNA